MPNRRRGKSVVLDTIPSLVTTEGEKRLPRQGGRGIHVHREALKEILMVLVGLVLVVWLFFGGQTNNSDALRQLNAVGSRPLQRVDSQFIIPSHFGSTSGSNARDGVKKAPGDKQVGSVPESKSSKKQTGTIFQYTGQKTPEVILVTVVDDIKHPREYIERIIENRVEYAKQHDFGLLVKYASELTKFLEESHNHQSSWARVALSLEALTTFPKAKWVWFLSDQSLIMRPEENILSKFGTNEALEPKMLRGVPVMRFDNTHIKTYFNNRVDQVSLVFTRNSNGLSSDSFLFKNDLYSKIWLELWAEPLYRTFNRFANEEEALGHIMQWHTQFLVRSAVVSPSDLGSSLIKDTTFDDIWQEIQYREKDMVVVVPCDFTNENCKREFQLAWNSRGRIVTSQKEKTPQKENKPQGQNQVQNQVQVQAQEKAQEKAEAAAQANKDK